VKPLKLVVNNLDSKLLSKPFYSLTRYTHSNIYYHSKKQNFFEKRVARYFVSSIYSPFCFAEVCLYKAVEKTTFHDIYHHTSIL